MKEWLRPKEAQEYCGVSKRTIQNWIKFEGLNIPNGFLLIEGFSQDF